MKKQQAKVLWAVLFINLGMFVIEFGAGIRADSISLTGDSLDMLGDALVYASSLYVINKGSKAQAGSAFLKGIIMFLLAIAVFARASYQLFAGAAPEATIMSTVGVVALLANLFCLLLLTRHREDNLNMSSVWLCSRNDVCPGSGRVSFSNALCTARYSRRFVVDVRFCKVGGESAFAVLERDAASIVHSQSCSSDRSITTVLQPMVSISWW
jgi:hypothetical protein